MPHTTLPDLEALDITGKTVRLADHAGDVQRFEVGKGGVGHG